MKNSRIAMKVRRRNSEGFCVINFCKISKQLMESLLGKVASCGTVVYLKQNFDMGASCEF